MESSAKSMNRSQVSLTTASILENDGAYGTWTKNPQPGNPYNQTYSTKPFIQQFPRNIMLFVGIGFTLTGGGIMINNKQWKNGQSITFRTSLKEKD